MLSQETLAMLKGLAKDVTTTGFTTGTGLVYYNLEPQAKRLLPKPTPLRNSISRVKSPTAGPGLAANWKAIVAADGGIVGAGTGQYPGVSEGHRNAFMSVTERNFTATFAALGKDIPTTFEAQFAGQGFDDIRGAAQITKLNALMISEEKMILGGNAGSGSGYNGFQLGTATAPTGVLNLASSGLANSKYVSAAVCLLTYWGLQFASVAGGVVTSFSRTNADASVDTIFGGSSAISALSNIVGPTDSTHKTATFTATAVAGALGYAWFVDIESSSTQSLGAATLAAITTVPTYTVSAAAAGTQVGSATGLNVDHSANSGAGGSASTVADFTGMVGWTASQGGYTLDLGGNALTANGDGTIAEFETLLLSLANNYLLTPETMYMSAGLLSSVTNKILTSATGSAAPIGAQRINFDSNNLGQVVGGSLATQYRSKFAGAANGNNSAGTIDIKWHPLLPDNVILFDFAENPYPDSNIPAVRRIQTMQEYYSIQWPLRTRQWEIGTYVNELFQHYVPFGLAMLTGVGHS